MGPTMPAVFAPDTVLVEGATLEVILEDGVGTGCVYRLRGLGAPPLELHLLRPDNVPALLADRDPAYLYFRYRGLAADGRPLYQQLVRD